MASGNEDFSRQGPKHLSSVDWHNANHRRSVTACLVNGAYVLESDRQEKRRGAQCLAPPWWEVFNFKLSDQLYDRDDNSIFGAIFEYTYHRSIDRTPRFVFAFRGTLWKEGSLKRDLDLDFTVIRNGIHGSSRFKTAMKAVQDRVSEVGSSNVWLTGHSLGAAIAMLAGKNMAKRGSFLEAYLFNPPFVSPPIERLVKDEKVRDRLRFAGTVIKAGLAFHRRKLQDMGAGKLAKLTSQHSLGTTVMSAVGVKGVETSEPLHLLPSVNLTENLNPTRHFSKDHGLNQWWKPNLDLSCRVYKY
ncbi:NC domain-containing-related-like protein [Hibiscus syriacus]|uniref:NC domain-containing-related-like protein n=1 Tax=Hibiscus syriacus TaxID=106335 RepID=A0A6A2YAB0_HIBSY|nr:NC domain-containing-related-like protein [Hibiscus syriacus]